MRRLRLRYLSGPRRGDELILSGPRVRIGRSRDNDVPLPEEPTPRSSAHHAEARLEESAWWIVDLDSTNGTLLNGARIQRAPLATGDTLTIGDSEFVVAIGLRRASWLLGAVALAATAAAAFLLIRQMQPSPFVGVAAAAQRSVYLLAVDEGGRRTAIGTAFAVDRDAALLATNAHIVDAMAARAGAGGRRVALLSDGESPQPLGREWVHPEWQRGSVAHDVALVELAGGAIEPLPLGDARAIDRLRRGAAVATFGFPAQSTDPHRPRGRLAVDVVGDVRLPYIEAGLFIAPGTSGSPVFDDRGLVIGMVVAGDFVKAGRGGALQPSGSGVNWVIAVTALRELLAMPR